MKQKKDFPWLSKAIAYREKRIADLETLIKENEKNFKGKERRLIYDILNAVEDEEMIIINSHIVYAVKAFIIDEHKRELKNLNKIKDYASKVQAKE